MKNIFGEIEPELLSDRIAQSVEEAIMSGAMKPGERINTDALARQFNVSHIPIREGLKKLEAAGVIEREPNKSARVVQLSKGDIVNILEVRKTLEGLAVSLAANRLDEGSKARLQTLVDRMSRASQSRNFVKMFAADKEFHKTIWGLSGNPFLAKSLSKLLLPYFGFMATKGYFVHRGQLDYVPRVHQQILDALASGNSRRAQKVLVEVHNRSIQSLSKE